MNILSGCNRNGYKEAFAISVWKNVKGDKEEFLERLKERAIEGKEAERLYYFSHYCWKTKLFEDLK